MARINPQLMVRLEQKLDVGRRRLNDLILSISNNRLVERETAALMLAAKNGIPIHRFSTPEQRSAMRGGAALPERPVQVPVSQGRRGLAAKKPTPKRTKRTDANSVFVVHGRDIALKKSMFEFLRSLDLKPLEWEQAILQAKDVNPHVDEVLDVSMGRVQAVVVIFSPDDDAMLTPKLHGRREPATERKLQGQPRPNVLFEAGWLLHGTRKRPLSYRLAKCAVFQI
jgi:hypothetical protein